MRPRRSHRKSRNGCQSCKQRRVKCDEAGPPCGNCRARCTDCRYASPEREPQHPLKVDTPGADFKITKDLKETDFPADRQLLQAKLMHRWSTSTYQSISSPAAKDQSLWQFTVPEMALQADFLLHGIFAISAFDIANSCGSISSLYVKTALEHQDLAIRSFQGQLDNATPDSCEASLYFSIMLVVLSLASARFVSVQGVTDNMIQNTAMHFELIRGIGVIIRKHDINMSQHPLFRYLKPIHELEKSQLDSSLEIMLNKLNIMNNWRASSARPANSRAISLYTISCTTALFWIQECFATCTQDGYRDYCQLWPSLAGKDYMLAVRSMDKIALLALMFWAVQVHWLRRDYWWAMDYGKSLVNEVSSILLPGADVTTKEIVSWAQDQVSARIDPRS